MAQQQRDDDGGSGCLAATAVVIAIAAVVAFLLSMAALVDPFAWMPTVGELWADCQDADRDACDLDER